jgi:hypothetical protein
MGRSLMTQTDLDALRLEGCFEPGVCEVRNTLRPISCVALD